MGILGRFKDIMSANINSILTKMEEGNAEELLEKYLRDANQNLEQVKSETANVMAQEKAAERKLAECEAEVTKFSNYAVTALKSGNEADAKKFLTYKNELETKKLTLQKEYVEAKGNSEKMRQMTGKLKSDIETAQGKLQELKMKLQIAKQQEKQNELYAKLNTNKLEGFDSLADSIQKRIDAAEARAELDKAEAGNADIADLAAKYESGASNGGQGDSVDDELLKMKAELGLL